MKLILSLLFFLVSTQVFSAEGVSPKHTIYGGIGKSENNNSGKSDGNPWSLGYLYHPESSKAFLGVDFAREGTSIDNTSRKYDAVDEGYSLNFIVGRDFKLNGDWGAGAGVLLGARETEKSCPDSYLGYECYADQDPDKEYDLNYGAVLNLTFKKALVGARVSGESSQLMLGIVF